MPSSHLFAQNFSLNYEKWNDLGDFINRVKINFDLRLSAFNISDIAPFVPEFRNIDFPIFAQGKVYGKISKLKSKNILLTLGESSKIETSFSLEGLPKYEDTFLNLNIKNLQLSSSDAENVLKKQKGRKDIVFPSVLNELEFIHYKGHITGFLTDLVAYGTFDNRKGIVRTDLRFKYNKNNQKYLFKGKIKTKDLDLSVLNLSDTIFDKVSMLGQINAELDSSNNWSGDLNGKISSIGINRYNYQNISMSATLKHRILESQITFNDSNLLAHFDSKIDLSSKEPYFDIKGNLQKAHPTILHWNQRSRNSRLSLALNAQFRSLNIDVLSGAIKINDFKYSEKNQNIHSDFFNIDINKIDKNKIIVINSDMLDARFEGEFTTTDLIDKVSLLSQAYLPALFTNKKTSKKELKPNIAFNIGLKNTYSAFKIFSPSLVIANGSVINGHLKSDSNSVNLTFISDSCRINDNLALNVTATIDGDFDKLHSDLFVKRLKISKELQFKNVNLRNRLKADSLSFYLSWMDKNLKYESAEIMAESIFSPSNFDSISCDINMIPSYVFIEDSIWYINDASIAIRGEQAIINQLIVNNKEQYLYANGTWQKGSSDSLQILLNQINLAYFSYLEKKTKLKMRGLVNGNVILSYKKQRPLISGYIQADTLVINDELLGNLSIKADWESEKEHLILDIVNELGKKHF